MKRPFFYPVFLLVMLLISGVTSAQNIIIEPPPMPPGGGVFTDPKWLSVDFHRVNIEVDNQLANTSIDLQFTNNGEWLAEGTFIFPLPDNAAVDRLTMFIDGEPFDAKILSADEARSIYNEIVRQYRDPALLEYVGTQAVQANVFPIPPGESRRVQIDYAQLLEEDNGLVEITYPIATDRFVDSLSLRVEVTDDDEIGAIYSPSHNLLINRNSDNNFTAGFEASSLYPSGDFTLYYGLSRDEIDLSLLTYRESADAEGFFIAIIQPPQDVPQENVTPKDIIIVLDQSGSMEGTKWEQAREAVTYVLENLNEQDRFNLIVFSTGARIYANEMQPVSEASGAVDWVNSLFAEGGTDINASLLQALDMVGERPTSILFLTDGEATEGVTETYAILDNMKLADKENARIFTFGVGDDVNTTLLDSIVRDFRGASAYVRPSQRIDEAVASLYNKIDSPVLTNAVIQLTGVMHDAVYPDEQSVTEIFAGEQIIIVGRYHSDTDNAAITINGIMQGQPVQYVFSGLEFPENAHGEGFIPRLWATRRIGDYLNTIRIRGENPELVNSIVTLSLRYGIITPYTSFLIEEDDILTQQGRERAAMDAEANFEMMNEEVTGADAVDRADTFNSMQNSSAPTSPRDMGGGSFSAADPMANNDFDAEGEEMGNIGGVPSKTANQVLNVNDKTFLGVNNTWTDTSFEPDVMETVQVTFLSDEYFELLEVQPYLSSYFSLGENVIVVVDDVAYEVVPEAGSMNVGDVMDVTGTVTGTIDDCAFDGICAYVIDSAEHGEVQAIWTNGMMRCEGQIDADIVIGDVISVFGEVVEPNAINACFSPDYFIRKDS